jgi:hypothetical protein
MRNKELQGLLHECGREVVAIIATFDRCDRIAKRTEKRVRELIPENSIRKELEEKLPMFYSISRDNAIRLASKQVTLSRLVESTYVESEHGKKVLSEIKDSLVDVNLAMSILEVCLQDMYTSMEA